MVVVPHRVAVRLIDSLVAVDGSDCLHSTYSVGSHGYVQMGWHENGKRFGNLGHRVAWMIAHGEIPDGLTIDHLCRNRRCINVKHLRLLTNITNAVDNGMSRKTHCPHGHPYSGDNVRYYTNWRTHRTDRRCVTCQKESNARRSK